jgi:septal ring factor EnvC (AmiA/AmiB activator)
MADATERSDNTFVDGFPWESEDQAQGYKNLQQFMRLRGREITNVDLNLVCAYFIQKDLESVDWWRDTVSSQTGSLEEQIRRQQEAFSELEKSLEDLRALIKSQGQTIDLLLKK